MISNAFYIKSKHYTKPLLSKPSNENEVRNNNINIKAQNMKSHPISSREIKDITNLQGHCVDNQDFLKPKQCLIGANV
jgi:hypothetical protein